MATRSRPSRGGFRGRVPTRGRGFHPYRRNTTLTGASEAAPTMQRSTGTSAAFGQTLQFITSIKLQELEKQRLSYQEHAKILEEVDAANDDLISKCEILLKAVESWSGSGLVMASTNLGGKLNIHNLHLWLPQAKQDPNFSPEILRSWIDTLETHVRHSLMRFDCAKLFGSLFNEWVASGDSSTALATSKADDGESTSSSEFVKVGRQEMHDQLDRLTSIIFDEKPIDTDALESYLSELFSGDEAFKALEFLRHDIGKYGTHLKRQTILETDVQNAIRGLLASGLMDEVKRATLAEFLDNGTVITEVTSVLNMRMAGLENWSWPAEGLVIEMRRHLNGKYRAFTDPEIVDALLLQYIGISWQVKLKSAFKRLLDGKAWKTRYPEDAPAIRERNSEQLGQTTPHSIEARRRELRKSHFFLSQLTSSAAKTATYDDLLDAPAGQDENSPAAIKQKFLQIMATECKLNSALHGTHAVIRSDLEWFGPSLPHASILTILKFFGVPDDWCSFFERFLRAPLRFKQDPLSQPRIRKRGTPISYALSVVCGEAVLFVMDFAVNQRAGGLFLYRMHDDLWLWDADATKCAAGWKEMNICANLVGLKFNREKTGSAWVGSSEPPGLPAGDVRWGFLHFDQDQGRFVIDQKDVDHHIAELRRQLTSTKSVFGWVNAYNKYMAFFLRNFGGRPALCFGDVHTKDIINTISRIQRELFPDVPGGAVAHLRSVIESRFGIRDLPQGYFYLPISSGGLELRHPMIEMFALRRASEAWTPDSVDFQALMQYDESLYKLQKENWESGPPHYKGVVKAQFMSLDEYLALRETWLFQWRNCYDSMLEVILLEDVELTPAVESFLSQGNKKWDDLDWYQQWIVSLYGEEVVKRFGGLEVVDATLIPVGMLNWGSHESSQQGHQRHLAVISRMFKKPLSGIKTSAPLRSSDRRKLKQRVVAAFGISSEDGDLLVPDGIQSMKFSTHLDDPGVAYLAPNGDPLWFTIGKGSEELVPTVYTLWKRRDLLPVLSTPAAVIPILVGGADLMIPGASCPPRSLPAGNAAGVYLTVQSLSRKSDFISSTRCRPYGGSQRPDHLWELGSKQDVPAAISVDAGPKEPVSQPQEEKADVEAQPDLSTAEALSKLTIEPSDAAPSAGPSYTPQEINELLHISLLQAIASAIPASAFPIPATLFYTNYILPSRPAFPALIVPHSGLSPAAVSPCPSSAEITIKSSTHKSLTAFLKSEEKASLLTLKAPQKHDLLVTSVNAKHPSVAGHHRYATLKDVETTAAKKALRQEKAREEQAGGGEVRVTELWKPHQATVGLFEKMAGDPTHIYSLSEVKTLLNSYISANSLVNPREQAYINLDEALLNCISSKAKGKAKSKDADKEAGPIEFMRRDELTRAILDRMQSWYQVSDGKEVVQKKGEIKPVQVVMKVRQGRKVSTLISGFEPFFVVNAEAMAEDLRKVCAGATSVSPIPGKPAGSGMEVLVQGKQSAAVVEYLTGKGIPNKWIEVVDASGKK
ncbi:putative reverse transcriptase (RNA-dependent DNA polymerase) [Lyophyllum shimeji]|uniref:Reverse transcriptase (RNA-dependent DNA polymerase) n=1 Tax=Lyophyllum shimeji TaxID=47721 RepID=A0A9P3Q0G5_LYOSH|nr:putative reverse transcriptase (RNA-dependent DNA polymerase) [Lyophyllum shimeji]